MMGRFASAAVWVGCFALGSVAIAADRIHPRIAGYERFYSIQPPKPGDEPKPADDEEQPVKLDPLTGGRLLLGELNCASCHLPDESAKRVATAKKAPILDDVGSRVKVDWVRSYLANPHNVKPGTTMPDLIGSLPVGEQPAAVDALVHFLASTGAVSETRSDPTAVKKGEQLFRKVGCLACHNNVEPNSPDLATSVPLPDLAKKYTSSSLMEFLKDPVKSRPSGRMPVLGLVDEEWRCVANYLVQDDDTTPNVKYSLFHGKWAALPKFDELKPVDNGQATGFDLFVAGRSREYAIQFTSYLRIVKPADYRFRIGADDGARLIIDDELVVDCDGLHPYLRKDGQKHLTAGFHKIVLDYFNAGGPAALTAEFSALGSIRQPLSGHLYLEPQLPASGTTKPLFSIDENLAKKGRELFGSLGCASCHQLTVDDQVIASTLKAKPLAELSTNAGCLAETVSGRVPRFDLSNQQRASIAMALKSRSDEAPAETAHRTLAALNCYACHERDKLGGVEDARNASFHSLQKEMGDEGRLPPTLTGVGDKLRPEWLRNVLNNSSADRKNYLLTLMPKFGAPNVEPLTDQFVSLDRRPDALPKVDFGDPEYRVKAAGRHLVGGQALSCVKCHDFGPYPSTGVRAISLTTMFARLRPEWFYRYVLDPQEYRRGTRMPAPWPFGKATVRDVLNADVNLQIQAVWLYLSDGENAPVPAGLVRESIELKPESEPIIYRNFIKGAGARGIAVGYPERVNLAFDANQLRLAMIWHGAFIDASRHWTGRSQGFEPPLGDDVIPMPEKIPFLKLDKPDQEVATEAGRVSESKFLGYRLDSNKRPVFRYVISGLTVEDTLIPTNQSGKPGTLKRKMRFEGPDNTGGIWLEAAEGKTISTVADGRYSIDDIWTMEVDPTGSVKPLVRTSGEKRQLLIPIRLSNGKATIGLNYVW